VEARRTIGGKAMAAAVLLLAGCIPASKPPPRRAPAPVSDKAILECRADLSREGVQYKALPDRRFDGGCTALGSVQLLDFGIPTTNLKAMTCPLARTFVRWAREAVQPAARAWLGAPVTRIETFGTYSCRPVNGQAGARLSEHGRANAVDIAAFVLADGRRITVLEGWNGSDEATHNFLRAVHSAGCRRFAVGLGPEANALHRDHLHFDLGAGPYCR
jgi:hypothetical protein